MKEEYDKKVIKKLVWIIQNIYLIDCRYIYLSILTTLINGIIPPVSVIIMQKILNGVQIDKSIMAVTNYIVIYTLIDILKSTYNNFAGFYNSKFIMKFNLYFSKKIYLKASKLSLADFENSKTYDIMNRAQSQGGEKLLGYYNSFLSILTQIITLISYMFILVKFNVWIVLVIMMIPIVRYYVNNLFNIKRFKILRERTNDSRKSWYITYLLSYGNFFKELKMFNLFSYFINRYTGYIQEFNKEDLKLNKNQTTIYSIISVVEIILDGFLFYFTISLGFSGIILIGDVITYIKSIKSSKSNITSILLATSNIINESLFIGQLFEYFELNEEKNLKKIKIDFISKVEIINLSYKYPNSDKYILRNINLIIEKNKKVAIVGENGSGKTTLIKLLMGFYCEYEGKIFINGIELRNIDKKSLINQISTLFQDFVKYEGTIRENIAYGNLSILDDDNKLSEIAHNFNFLDLINRNEKKLDTQLGVWFDSGINLSAGQWQKIALARTFAKDSSIYILDEPNASMDTITEREIAKLYSDILKNKIGIIIAHRFINFTNFVDEIIVLKDGKIVERGTHDELIIKNGKYSKLF